MDGPTARMLFEALREDIAALKQDVTAVIVRHEQEIDELREFKWRVAGALAVVVVIFEVGAKLLGHALK